MRMALDGIVTEIDDHDAHLRQALGHSAMITLAGDFVGWRPVSVWDQYFSKHPPLWTPI